MMLCEYDSLQLRTDTLPYRAHADHWATEDGNLFCSKAKMERHGRFRDWDCPHFDKMAVNWLSC